MATWAVLAALEFLGLGVVTAWLVHYFAMKNTPWIALVTVYISWCVASFDM